MNWTGKRDYGMYRLWIARVSDWEPRSWSDVPSRARPLEAALEGCFSAAQAAAFLEGFNGQMLEDDKPYWAVATRVRTTYQGDLQPSNWISARRLLHCMPGEA